MISITTNTIHTQTQTDSIVSGMNGLLISWLRFFDTRRETILTTWPYYFDARHILWCLRSVGRDPKNPTTSSTAQIQLSPQWLELNSLPPWSNLNWLFQNPQILRTISSRHDVIHTPVPFPFWGFIMTMIVISFACMRKLHQLSIHRGS